jgi:hypothetical protein
MKYTVEKAEGAIKNGKSRKTSNTMTIAIARHRIYWENVKKPCYQKMLI